MISLYIVIKLASIRVKVTRFTGPVVNLFELLNILAVKSTGLLKGSEVKLRYIRRA